MLFIRPEMCVHEVGAGIGSFCSWFSVGSAHFSDPARIRGDLEKAL